MAKTAFNNKKTLVTSKLIELINYRSPTFGVQLCMVLKLGDFGKLIRNIWKVLKCGTEEGRKRAVGPIMRQIKKRYRAKEESIIVQKIKRRKAN